MIISGRVIRGQSTGEAQEATYKSVANLIVQVRVEPCMYVFVYTRVHTLSASLTDNTFQNQPAASKWSLI